MPPLSSNLIRYKKPIFLSTEEMAQTTPQTIAPIASPLQRASGAISGISEGVGRFMKPRLENLSKQFEPENIADTALAFSPLGFTKKVGTYGAEFAKQQIKRNAPKGFQGLKNLSTKLLEKFKGMPNEITPQQFNEVINRATKEGIRKADLDLVKGNAKEVNGKINLTKLSQGVETQLVPLTSTPVKSPRWSNVGEDFIGDGKYGEIVYQSPIKTSAGDVHFHSTERMNLQTGKTTGGEAFPNYFSHIRYEDMADGKTRKILETQSDLMQKENFARELSEKISDDVKDLRTMYQGDDVWAVVNKKGNVLEEFGGKRPEGGMYGAN